MRDDLNNKHVRSEAVIYKYIYIYINIYIYKYIINLIKYNRQNKYAINKIYNILKHQL